MDRSLSLNGRPRQDAIQRRIQAQEMMVPAEETTLEMIVRPIRLAAVVGSAGSSLCKILPIRKEKQADSDPSYSLLLAIVAYFVLGAYYNYTTYGASGSDLIP